MKDYSFVHGYVWVYMCIYSTKCYSSILYYTLLYYTVMSVYKNANKSVCQYLSSENIEENAVFETIFFIFIHTNMSAGSTIKDTK